MAAFFLEEFKKSKYSRLYKEYTEILPASCHNYPIFFDDNELAELKGSPFAAVIQERQDNLYNDWGTIKGIIHQFNYPFE